MHKSIFMQESAHDIEKKLNSKLELLSPNASIVSVTQTCTTGGHLINVLIVYKEDNK